MKSLSCLPLSSVNRENISVLLCLLLRAEFNRNLRTIKLKVYVFQSLDFRGEGAWEIKYRGKKKWERKTGECVWGVWW